MTGPERPLPRTGLREPRLYADLASLWPRISPPEYYREEAATVSELIGTAAGHPVRRVLELGSGGGHLASHLRRGFDMTLVDRSRPMLELSRALNPACAHHEADMEAVRLGERFDAVLVYDAVSYVTTEAALARVLATAHAHLGRGGVLLLGPDAFRETFEARVYRGRYDDEALSVTYEERSWDPDPEDSLVTSDFVFHVRPRAGRPRTYRDRHTFGLFARRCWLDLVARAGFAPRLASPAGHRDFVIGRLPLRR
jgi:SAM-dependent methyltransferase